MRLWSWLTFSADVRLVALGIASTSQPSLGSALDGRCSRPLRRKCPTYSEQYDESKLLTSKEYPANFFRLQKIKRRVAELGLGSVYELGIGDG